MGHPPVQYGSRSIQAAGLAIWMDLYVRIARPAAWMERESDQTGSSGEEEGEPASEVRCEGSTICLSFLTERR